MGPVNASYAEAVPARDITSPRPAKAETTFFIIKSLKKLKGDKTNLPTQTFQREAPPLCRPLPQNSQRAFVDV